MPRANKYTFVHRPVEQNKLSQEEFNNKIRHVHEWLAEKLLVDYPELLEEVEAGE